MDPTSMSKTGDKIECPKCGAEIPLTETLQRQLTEGIRKEVEASLLQDAEKKARESVGVELKDVRTELAEKTRKLDEAQRAELELRKRERKLEDDKKELELSVERRIGEERKVLQEKAAAQAVEDQRLKSAEKDKRIQDLTSQLESALRKAEQGSQQLQGEVQEIELESVLKEAFPLDGISAVPKGIHGGDVVQKVFTRTGALCGSILWESKRTKAWSDGWLDKLKEDQRAGKCDLAAIVTETLPRDIQSFGQKEQVWVTGRSLVVPVAAALRLQLIQVAFARTAAEHKDRKIEVLYAYLTGPEFRQRVEAVVENFIHMRSALEQEKRATRLRWAKQEKHLDLAMQAVVGMHGDLQGLAGSAIQSIPALEVHEGTDAPLLDPASSPKDYKEAVE
jgi:hypothetical protein